MTARPILVIFEQSKLGTWTGRCPAYPDLCAEGYDVIDVSMAIQRLVMVEVKKGRRPLTVRHASVWIKTPG